MATEGGVEDMYPLYGIADHPSTRCYIRNPYIGDEMPSTSPTEHTFVSSMEHLTRAEQLERAKHLSDVFVSVLEEAGTPLYVSEASARVADRLGISVAQTSYGVSFARNTGSVQFDEANFMMSALPNG